MDDFDARQISQWTSSGRRTRCLGQAATSSPEGGTPAVVGALNITDSGWHSHTTNHPPGTPGSHLDNEAFLIFIGLNLPSAVPASPSTQSTMTTMTNQSSRGIEMAPSLRPLILLTKNKRLKSHIIEFLYRAFVFSLFFDLLPDRSRFLIVSDSGGESPDLFNFFAHAKPDALRNSPAIYDWQRTKTGQSN